MVFCPYCESENPEEAIFCQECGEVIINIIRSHEKLELIEKILTAKLEDDEDFNKIMYMILTYNIVENYNFDVKEDFAKEMIRIMNHNGKSPIHERIMPDATVERLSKYLKGNIELTETIYNTELMRASSLAEWCQNKRESSTFYIVDNKPDGCKECIRKYEGNVFNINQIDMLPPTHSKCTCVASFFFSEERARESAIEIKTGNESRRKELESAGYTLPDDGSAALAPGVTLESYKDSKRRYYAYKTVEQQMKLIIMQQVMKHFFMPKKI